MTQELGTVMLIDDEDIDQRQYKRILTRSGLAREVIQFTYADLALDWLATEQETAIDLIFLDINMPRMTGFGFLETAQTKFPALDDMTVIMLTTSLNPQDRSTAMAYPAVKAFFNKPLTPDHLEQAVTLLPKLAKRA